MKRARLIAGGLLVIGSLTPVVSAAPTTRPVVVELFTSQGCSSCPPADALLGELAARPGVLALAFHVQYWDSLGWRDPFGLAESAARQSRYATLLSRSGSFTPQAIVDGAQSEVGSNRPALTAALTASAGPAPAVPVQASVEDGNVVVKLAAQNGERGADVVAVSYLAKAVTRVARGENGGRALTEFNIVRSIHTLGSWHGEAAVYKVPLASLPADATALALLVQHANQGSILGATSVALH
jgi:hypothetical protein